MTEITITTFDWVPALPSGYVRDIRLRWALEEAGLEYAVQSTPFRNRTDEHYRHQPFGQVPWLTHGEITVFESGADLLYVAEASGKLMPADPKGRIEVIKWLFAGLNSVEMAVLPFTICPAYVGKATSRPAFKKALQDQLDHFAAAD